MKKIGSLMCGVSRDVQDVGEAAGMSLLVGPFQKHLKLLVDKYK